MATAPGTNPYGSAYYQTTNAEKQGAYPRLVPHGREATAPRQTESAQGIPLESDFSQLDAHFALTDKLRQICYDTLYPHSFNAKVIPERIQRLQPQQPQRSTGFFADLCRAIANPGRTAPFIDLSDRSVHLFDTTNVTTTTVPPAACNRRRTDTDRAEEEKTKNDKLRVVVGTVAAVAGVILLYLSGKNKAVLENQQDENDNFEVLKEKWTAFSERDCFRQSFYRADLNAAIEAANDILATQEHKQKQKNALLGAGALGAVVAFVGAVANSRLLMASGGILGALAGGVGVYKLGYDNNDRFSRTMTERLEKSLNRVSEDPLHSQLYTDYTNMAPTSSARV